MTSSKSFVLSIAVLTIAIFQHTLALCGYESCPETKHGFINIHIVPHTHDDVGWLKNVDQYYYGSANRYQKAGVQYIIDSVITELQKNSERKFIYVEMEFFSQWWKEQTPETKSIVRGLVTSGRLEFINGGWCMNDEATTHYNDIVDQMTWGLRFLNDTFGECGRPRIAWQIDPFGHSREQASLFALMGYDGLFFARLDWVDKVKRLSQKEMEMVWLASNSLGEKGSIFTGALYDHYGPPSGFCFDLVNCNDAPIMDNPKSPEYNVPQRVDEILEYARNQAERYATNQIMFTMGSDFHYMTAHVWFKNIDKLIKYVNARQAEGSNVHMFYSTPSCYVKALNEAGNTWPVKTDDFFPYSSDPHAYWTGYFTSRPTVKGMVRKSNNLLQATKQLFTLSGMNTDNQSQLDFMRRQMGIAQHHDAVSGTEKQHVTDDYTLRLHEGAHHCQDIFSNALDKLMSVNNQPLPVQQFCLSLNISECAISESSAQFVVTAYNPRSQSISHYLRLPVSNAVYSVVDSQGNEVQSQLVPIPGPVQSLKERVSTATHDLVFQAVDIPPLGYKSFYVQKLSLKKRKFKQTYKKWTPRNGQRASIGNEKVGVTFGTDGLIESVSVNGVSTPLRQNLLWYRGMNGRNYGFDDRASGAYIFRPNGTDAMPISDQAKISLITGSIVQEVHQTFSDWASQVIRIYQDSAHVEIEWIVGPIPVDDEIGKEIVSRVTTDFETNGEFYTDSNGRQTLLRKRDFRPTWQLNVTEPVAGNYYPINSHIYITSPTKQTVTLVTDRSQGGTSLHDGEIELMVHRRLLWDDAFGVGEALNEPGDGPGLVARGVHYLVIGNPETASPMSLIRPLTQSMVMGPWLTFTATELSFQQWSMNFVMEKSGLSTPLAANAHILTLEPWSSNSHLLRLEHPFDANEDHQLSAPVTIELDGLFADYVITSAEETTLGANQWVRDSQRFQWTTNPISQVIKKDTYPAINTDGKMAVTLQPMEIRTFIIQLTPK